MPLVNREKKPAIPLEDVIEKFKKRQLESNKWRDSVAKGHEPKIRTMLQVFGELLVKAIESAQKKNLNLSDYISVLLAHALECENDKTPCLKGPISGICLQALPKDAKISNWLRTV
jgi:hypothetical protein